jgi:hypothetical protein
MMTFLALILTDGGLVLENRSHRPVLVEVDAANRVVKFDSGTEVARKSTAQFDAPDGEYRVVVGGRKTSHTITLPATITVRGCANDEFEVLTAYVGKKTFRLLTNISGQAYEPAARVAPKTRVVARVDEYGLFQFLRDVLRDLFRPWRRW